MNVRIAGAAVAVLLISGCAPKDDSPMPVPPMPKMTQAKADAISQQIAGNPKLSDAQKSQAIAAVRGMVGR